MAVAATPAIAKAVAEEWELYVGEQERMKKKAATEPAI